MKFSVGILSWKRVSNIRSIVDEYIFHDDLIDEIIIWNNNPEEHIEFGDGYDIVKVINCKNLSDFGLITRFCAGTLSRNAMILLQDDDFILPYESLVKLRDEWVKEPDCFHTFFGRGPKDDGTYGKEYFPKAPICGRLYVMDRKYCGLILHEYWNLDEHMRNLIHSKGDDILASYVMTHYTGKLHSVHKIDYQQLDESYALHYGKNRPIKPMTDEHAKDMDEWISFRTNMMQSCELRFM